LSQQLDSSTNVNEKKLMLFLKDKEVGAYAFVGTEYAPGLAHWGLHGNLAFGITYGGYLVGFSYQELLYSPTDLLIFPNTFSLKMKSAGVQIGFRLHDSNWVNAILNSNYRWGEIIWQKPPSDGDQFSSHVQVLEPEIAINIGPLKWIKLTGKIGYRTVFGLNLPKVQPNDFSGLSSTLGLRICLNYARN
jgi:hypothetical protein